MAFADFFGSQAAGASPAWASVDGTQWQNGAPGVGTTQDGGAGLTSRGTLTPQQQMLVSMVLRSMQPRPQPMMAPLGQAQPGNVTAGGVQGAI